MNPVLEVEELSEAVELAVGDGFRFGPDKTVPVHIIRPGVGKGRGRHLYEAKMLERDAHKFAGWKMYVDHRSREAQKAAGGLPRGVRDLGGRVLEAAWDPTVPADPARGFGQGAVVGQVRPVKWLREMIEDDPELVETSISATATGIRQVKVNGQPVILVEGIGDKGSVDWVTEAGAGGRVAPLIEASFASDEDVEMALLESMTDDEVRGALADTHPEINLEEAGDEEPHGSEDEEDEGYGPDLAQEAAVVAPDHEQGGDDEMITPEALREAFQQSPEVQDFVRGLVESTLDEERDTIRAEAQADARRDMQLQRLEIEAQRLIEASGLPSKWRDSVHELYALSEAGDPSPALDVVDEIDEFGSVVKHATEVLRESVEGELAKQRELLAEANPTRVRGQGRQSPAAAGEKRSSKETGWGKYLSESVGVDPDRAFALTGAGDDA